MADYRRLPGPRAEHWQWQARGACRGMQLSVFFHPTFERGENHRRREAHAKAVCRRCPVLTACREHALRVAEPYGVWGGLSAEEREDLLATQHRTGAMPTTVPSNSRDEVPVG